MSIVALAQNTEATIALYLSAGGLPVYGLSDADVTVEIKQPGSSYFTSYPVDSDSFYPDGDGVYMLVASSSATSLLGTLYFKVTIDNFYGGGGQQGGGQPGRQPMPPAPPSPTLIPCLVTACGDQVNPGSLPTLPTTAIHGYLVDGAGRPKDGATVISRVIQVPSIMQVSMQGVAVTGDSKYTKSDAAGMFLLDMITGSTVEIIIPVINYRRVLVVPPDPANLFEIP